jgi:hypothetical protein
MSIVMMKKTMKDVLWAAKAKTSNRGAINSLAAVRTFSRMR